MYMRVQVHDEKASSYIITCHRDELQQRIFETANCMAPY